MDNMIVIIGDNSTRLMCMKNDIKFVQAKIYKYNCILLIHNKHIVSGKSHLLYKSKVDFKCKNTWQ